MLKNKTAVASLAAALLLLQASPAVLASESNTALGNITIKSVPTKSEEEKAIDSILRQRDETNMGKLVIANDIISGAHKNKKKDSPEIARIKTHLAEVIQAMNGKDYEKGLVVMKHLHAEHPESRVILKWLGIYQNWAGEYADSAESFEKLRFSYSLSSEKFDKDFMVKFYETDNARHLGTDVKSSLDELKDLAEKQEDFMIGGIRNRELASTLAEYQQFMVETDCGKTLTPTDSKALDKLWKRIPKQKQAHLDNYFGYNIDELTPIYAEFYRRKDLVNAYEERAKKRAAALADGIEEKSEGAAQEPGTETVQEHTERTAEEVR